MSVFDRELAYFRTGKYAKKGVEALLSSEKFYRQEKQYHSIAGPIGGGTAPYLQTGSTRTSTYVLIGLDGVAIGGAPFLLTRRVFLQRAFHQVFRIFRLTSFRLVHLPDAALDGKWSVFTSYPEAFAKELKKFWTPEVIKALHGVTKKNFRGEFLYSGASLIVKTEAIPEHPHTLNFDAIDCAFDAAQSMRTALEKIDVPSSKERLFRLGEWIYKEREWERIEWEAKERENPYPKYTHTLEAFFSLLGSVVELDTNYAKKPVQEWFNTPQKIDSLSADDLRSAITFIIRSERFGDGNWLAYWKSGVMWRILQRLREV